MPSRSMGKPRTSPPGPRSPSAPTAPRKPPSLQNRWTAVTAGVTRQRRSVARPAAQGLQRPVLLLVVEPAALGGLAGPGLLARHRRAGRLAGPSDPPGQYLLAIALLA